MSVRLPARRYFRRLPESIIARSFGKSIGVRPWGLPSWLYARTRELRTPVLPSASWLGGPLLVPGLWVIVRTVCTEAPEAPWQTRTNREASMHLRAKAILVAGATALAATSFVPLAAQAQDSEPVHIALADLPEVETLFFLVGLARAGEQGLDYELTFFNGEELAIQAILAGQADVGLGSPYAVIQRASVPIRLFQQTSRIIFFPVAKAEIESWQDMDGKSMTYHSRGGPLEALAAIVAEREGITLGTPNYVPGSENRVVALVQGHVDAAIIDLLNKNMIMEEHPDQFRVLPWVSADEVVTDEALFARLDWIQENEDKVALMVEELLKSARDICANPAMIAEE